MAVANTPTLLSLDRFAYTLGMSPAHFNGGKADPVFPITRDCGEIYTQYAWQSEDGLVSRDEIAQTIAVVEEEIKSLIGYSPAPAYETDEKHEFPHHVAGVKSMQTQWGYVINPGERAADVIEAGATVVYSDPDGDGFDELATVTVSTTVENRQEIKVFYPGEDGDVEWEIRHVKDVVVAGGTATITIDAWQLVKPELLERLPTADGVAVIDFNDVNNLLSTVDVYHVYTDTSASPATFHSYSSYPLWHGYWSVCPNCSGVGCDVCNPTTQSGCFQIIDSHNGYIRPYPASFADGSWTAASFDNCVAPAQVAFNYYAGYRDDRYLRGRTLDPLSQFFAEIITYMVVARLPKRICGCPNVSDWARTLQTDLSILRAGEIVYAHFEKQDIFSSPFGTRNGEVMAWQRLGRVLQDTVMSGGGF